MKALKFDEDKLPWDLLPVEATEGMLRILAYGARKYTTCGDCKGKVYKNPRLNGDPITDTCPDCNSKNIISGRHNWRKGFNWTRLVASTYRHLAEIMKGEMIDPESGEYHVHHLMCCVAFLAEHITSPLGEDDLYKKR